MEIEVAVNYEFTRMLDALRAKGAFGAEQTTLPALKAILAEAGMRLFVLGESLGASLEAAKQESGK